MSEKSEKKAKCPVCRSAIVKRSENKAFPFCSDRCRMIDLGRWLGEDYTISEPARSTPGPGKDDLM